MGKDMRHNGQGTHEKMKCKDCLDALTDVCRQSQASFSFTRSTRALPGMSDVSVGR